MKKQATTIINERNALQVKPLRKHLKNGTLTAYFEVGTYLLELYFTDDVTAETDVDVMELTQPPNKTPMKTAELIWAMVLRSSRVHREYVLKCNCIKAISDSITKHALVLSLKQTCSHARPGTSHDHYDQPPERLVPTRTNAE